jgi:two-component system chemotaxis response regulator CheY
MTSVLKDLRILLVDDKPFIRSLVNSMLLRAGVRLIAQAASGDEALKELAKAGGQFDCIISDFNMQPMNGLQLLQAIRAAQVPHTAPDICFILLTGSGDAVTVNLAIALDVHGYLVKPVSYEGLFRAIENGMQREIRLQGPRTYLSVAGLEVAKAHAAEPARVPPWVVWLSKSAKRADWEDRLRAATLSEKARTVPDGLVFRRTERIPITEITSGSILAEGVVAPDGRLLLAANTVLKDGILTRLRELARESGEDMKLLIGWT